MHPDPFIRSMSFWLVKDYNQSLSTLLDTSQEVVRGLSESADKDVNSYTSQIGVFNFYNYLRTHPLIIRQLLATTAVDKCQTVLLSGFSNTNEDYENTQYIDYITPVERKLYFTTAHNHFKSGCPMLALEVLSKLPEVVDVDSNIKNSRSVESVMSYKQSMISTGTIEATVEKTQVSRSGKGRAGGRGDRCTLEECWQQRIISHNHASSSQLFLYVKSPFFCCI